MSSSTSTKPSKAKEATENEQATDLSSLRVLLLGLLLVGTGAAGFYNLPGMIKEDAGGSRIVNSIYCSAITLTTIGFGDICPGDLDPISKLFIVLFALSGLGFFCGPLLDIASSWTKHVPGGLLTMASLTVGLGVAVFSHIEGVSHSEAFYASIITGTTIGYGDLTPRSDVGKLAVAFYAIMVVNVVAGLLKPGRMYLEQLCHVRRTVPRKPIPVQPKNQPKKASKKEE